MKKFNDLKMMDILARLIAFVKCTGNTWSKKCLAWYKQRCFPTIMGCSYEIWSHPLRYYHTSCQQHGLEKTLKDTRHLFRRFKPHNIKCLLKTFDLLETHLKAAHLPSTKNRKLIIHIPCWSRRYAEKCMKCLLPSLLAQNNVPWLSTQLDVLLLFHCDRFTKDMIGQSAVAKQLSQIASIEWVVIPDRIFKNYKQGYSEDFKYLFLALLQGHVFKWGMQELAYLSFQLPDLLVSETFYRTLYENAHDKALGLATACCVDYNKAAIEIDKFFKDDTKTILEIPSAVLSSFQMDHMHLRSGVRVVSPETKNFFATSQLIFKLNNSILTRTFHYHPFLMNCAKINPHTPAFYLPIDDDNLSKVIYKDIPVEKQVWAITDSTTACFCELSDEYAIPPQPACDRFYSQSELIQALVYPFRLKPTSYLTPLQIFLFSQRARIRSISSQDEQAVDDIIFIEQLEAALFAVSQK